MSAAPEAIAGVWRGSYGYATDWGGMTHAITCEVLGAEGVPMTGTWRIADDDEAAFVMERGAANENRAEIA